ncbi:quinolinate synthase NadA [Magnetofaba australis]|uniref:Quinolinate synthase n=1 Tax=Magnetofaba australis IT-1 TaxID=1434232 RepID=A0A1Y2K4F5_9PROT|nr:quinolinate synthase NadA [Magnetofaba australis]OSM04245.1 putative quinolinate synthetase [Magnetofaba australis IT-1]
MNTPVALEPLYELDDAQLDARIEAAKEKLGESCVILGHHYQREEVYKFADLTGDSLKLARLASQRPNAKHIVFCGVHFMAEVADILSSPEQIAILPDLNAGCSMADMADLPAVEECWKQLATVIDPEASVTPITYVNSAADLKAFCGDHNGTVCTSSNAEHILTWAFDQREKVLFFPDQHLGRNASAKLGVPLEKMVVWDPNEEMGGLTAEQIKEAKVILWHGFCSVHQMFQPQHIDMWRERIPGVNVMCHPECSYEVCQKADALGSTEGIQAAVRAGAPGSKWVIGTELNLVNRLKHEMPDKEIHFLSPSICMCSTMFRIDPQHLCWTLENLLEGHVVNPITVPAREAASAKIALERMLAIV